MKYDISYFKLGLHCGLYFIKCTEFIVVCGALTKVKSRVPNYEFIQKLSGFRNLPKAQNIERDRCKKWNFCNFRKTRGIGVP